MTAMKPNAATTSRRRLLIAPICFVHVLCFGIYNSTIVLFFPEYLGKSLFPNISTSETSDSSVCNSATNISETENGKVIQAEVARFSIYASLCVGIPCIISNLFLGSISDRYGRKNLLMIPTIGLLFAELSTAGLMYFNINLYYFLILMIVQGFVGDTFSLVQFVMSYISDITENNRSRTFAIASIECCIGMGVVVGGLVAGYVIEAFGYIWPVVISASCKLINICFICCLPPTDIQNKEHDPWTLKTVGKFLKQSLEFYYSKKYDGQRWKYNICITVYILGCVCLIGRNAAEVLYVISPPFCFSPVLVGWYHAAQHTLQQGISMILIRLFLVFMKAETISVMGAVSGIAGFIVQAFAESTIVLFMSLIAGFGMALGIPTMRAIMSKETPRESQGALFGGMAAAQTACTYFGSLVFGAIYEGTVYFFNVTVFVFMGALCLISLVLSIFLLVIPKLVKKKQQKENKAKSGTKRVENDRV